MKKQAEVFIGEQIVFESNKSAGFSAENVEILEYDEATVRIAVGKIKVRLYGHRLFIGKILPKYVCIEGLIHSLEFEEVKVGNGN